MLYKIIFKNFKSNLKSYILFFISNIIAVAELFAFWGMNSIIKNVVSDEVTAEALRYDFWIAAGLVTFITVFLMVFAMRNYIKLRIKDYSTFILLGMKKRMSYMLVLMEYVFGCLASLILGLVAGNGLLYGVQKVFYNIYPEFIKMSKVGIDVYKNTCYLCLGIMAGVFIILMVWLDSRDLSTLMSKADKKEGKPKGIGWIVLAFIGIALVALAFYQYVNGHDLAYLYSHIIWLFGGFLILAFGGSILLESLRKNKKFYRNNLLRVNQLYTKYQSNILIVLLLFVIHFFALTYLATEVAALLPLDKYRENYPYDAIWMAQEKDEEYCDELAEKYHGKVTSIPMVRVTTYWGAEHIGVSASDYEKLTGIELHLSDRQIAVGIEDREYEKEKKVRGEEYVDNYEWLYIGKYIPELADYRQDDEEFMYEATDLYTQNVLGQYSTDQWKENMIIFSDDYFKQSREKILKDKEEPSVLGLFEFPKSYREEATNQLKKHAVEHSVKENADQQSVYYNTDEFVIAEKMRLLFSVASKLFILLALLVSGAFVIGLKNLSEYELYERRYEFLEHMGMKKKKRKKNLGFEIRSLPVIAITTSLCMGVLYAIAFVCKQKQAGTEITSVFWKYWILLIGVYIGVEYLIEKIFVWYMQCKLGRKAE